MPAGVKVAWDVGAEVAPFSGDDDESVVVAEFVTASVVTLIKTEAAEEAGEDVKASGADVGDAAVASLGVEEGDVGCVELGEAPLGLILTCR